MTDEAKRVITDVVAKLEFRPSNKSFLGNAEYSLPELAKDRTVTIKSGDRKGEQVVIHSSVDPKEQKLLDAVISAIKKEGSVEIGKFTYKVEATKGGDFKEALIREKAGASIDEMLAALA